ncbi:MAG: hypothetical protein B7Y56_04345 [Gallionellales bacterium 35-53-114]|jgi:phosphate transport system substrate-binding protein|nr:MAG: hypothetical protein B7Y56_04345 [Gallionellales bacterium 35-53-114]OYZ65323.1 MAG: hypothetical protein B7Y04_01500 [Gallionellales bacterium 24-53-125]OZB08230.1 MAG: hypothetical protein B7X61_11955 [Gallionellales bacterium 39-52-133]
MGVNMKVLYKIASAAIFSLITSVFSLQVLAVEILGGGGNPADKLIMDWSAAKPGNRANTVKFSASISSNDLTMLKNGKIDFAILDNPLSDAELGKMNLLQFPFALNGISIVVNLQNNMAGTLRLDSATLGKIFSGEITNWDDPAITALNSKHELPNKPIIIIHSGETSTDYSVLNDYIGDVNEKWKAGSSAGAKREWPANSIYTDRFAARISSIKSTPFSLSYLPMQYMPQPSISAVHIKNREGNFAGLSDTGIVAATSAVNVEDGHAASLAIINKSGKASWPISNFSFVVVNRERVREEKIVQFLNIISYGLKSGSLKATVHNYVALPEQLSKPVMERIEALTTGTGVAGKAVPAKAGQESAQEALANKQRNEDELSRQRTDAQTAAQDERSRAEERNRAAKQQLAEEAARAQAIKEARAAKQAADEAIKAAQAAKLEAEKQAEKSRLIAKAEKEKADRERAEKERAEKEQAEKERAIQLRNQKDEDPLEAYRRSM